MLGNYDKDLFEVDFDFVRQIPERGVPVDAEELVEGAIYDCWYAQEEKFYAAIIDCETETGTVMVMFDGWEDKDEVPIQYLLRQGDATPRP